MKPGTRLTWIYLFVQAVSGLFWWIWLIASPSSQAFFAPAGLPDSYVLSYGIADGLIFVAGSALASMAFFFRMPFGKQMLWILAGGTWYASLHCIGLQLLYGGHMPPVIMMLSSAVATTALACTSKPSDPKFPVLQFRETQAKDTWPILGRTFVQIILFWGMFLAAIPMTILFVEQGIGMEGFEPNSPLGWGLFFTASILGLSSSLAMVFIGHGTPLPTDTAPVLVVGGPYIFVRNPMVIAGLLQGVGVMLIIGSWLMLPYIVLGGLFWELCVRPVEEQDLKIRFGKDYERYCESVYCWIPVFRRKVES